MRARSLLDPLRDRCSIAVLQRHDERHLAERMGGAREAGIEGADGDLDMVEQPFRDLAARKVLIATFFTARFIASLLLVVETIRLALVTWSFSSTV